MICRHDNRLQTWGKRGEPQSIATADDVGGADDAGSAKNRLWMHLSRSDYGHGDWVVWEYELKQQVCPLQLGMVAILCRAG